MAVFLVSIWAVPVCHSDRRLFGRGLRVQTDGSDPNKKVSWKAQYSEGSPINDGTSYCRKWWHSSTGPGTIGDRASSVFYESREQQKRTEHSKGMNGYAVGMKEGCTTAFHAPSTIYHICGCYEMWCPIKNHYQGRKDDWRKRCFSQRNIAGCFKNDRWNRKCFHETGWIGPYWEQMLF